jgi:hypothetical protein
MSQGGEMHMRLNNNQATFFNICLILILFKLKEFETALTMAKDIARDLEKQTMMSLNT